MRADERGARRWSIGELARATGVTVRTLHHYDEIGLVPASERTASGHRRYTEGDLRRLRAAGEGGTPSGTPSTTSTPSPSGSSPTA
ncbi:hypothetical protein Ssi03_68680 [Sphaerisporangium siamense]|uniref:HTH merR-type domain-containing protein n=1 Tax=Sphaerisporangium siamense TaxID=795645 RepID=A0A7W7D5E0_9ACTN|nr:hypothetical protein [Sphaerisporangium siamense]GII88878.1 hypothetical protein Ssi03_68680 [Sphaerisporangium siamense]